MAEAINCPSCGAANQLPEGKTSMFCSFCANVVERKIHVVNSQKEENPLITKPEISKPKTRIVDGTEEVINKGGTLSLINRGLTSFSQVTGWYSDNELQEVKILNLQDNKIKSFKGVEKFKKLKKLDLSNNLINENPPNVWSGSPPDIILNGNPIILQNNDAKCESCSKQFKKYSETQKYCSDDCYYKANKPIVPKEIPKTSQNDKKSGCFIATATMGNYNHPVVVDLRVFRDEWLLQRNWGVTFTNWYYKHGPKAASVIAKSIVLKKLTFIFIVKPLQLVTKNLR